MFQSIPVVTRNLLIANIVLFGLQQLAGDWMIINLALWPLGEPRMAGDGSGGGIEVGFQVWQLLTYGFLHGGLTHLAFNMFDACRQRQINRSVNEHTAIIHQVIGNRCPIWPIADRAADFGNFYTVPFTYPNRHVPI